MIRILFLDTSALLSFFMSDNGTPAMRWLISSDNKAHGDTRYVINNQVIREFEDHLKKMAAENDIKQSTADSILALFNTHYKNRKFKVVGKEASVQDTIDGMYNYLGRLSRPVLVTCNQEQALGNSAYKVINPARQTTSDIELLLHGKQKSTPGQAEMGKTENTSLYQRLFRKTRMTLAL